MTTMRRFAMSLLLASAACSSAYDEVQTTSDPIRNGRTINETEFPSMVALLHSDGEPQCTATKVGDRTLLTAAHCVWDVDKGGLAPYLAGRVIQITNRPTIEGERTTLRVRNITVHPEWMRDCATGCANEEKNKGVGVGVDLAILEVEEATPSIPIASVDLRAVEPGERLQIAGYGCDAVNVFIPVGGGVRRAGENVALAPAAGTIDTRAQESAWAAKFVLMSMTSGSFTCNGDSGGPAFRNGYVVGVTHGYWKSRTLHSRVDADAHEASGAWLAEHGVKVTRTNAPANHVLTLPVVFDGTMALPDDAYGSIVSIFNPTSSTASVDVVARDPAGSVLALGAVSVGPLDTVMFNSLDARGLLFNDRTRGKEIAVTLQSSAAITANATLLRASRTTGRPLGAAENPFRVTVYQAARPDETTNVLFLPQLPTAHTAGEHQYNSRVTFANSSASSVTVRGTCRTPGGSTGTLGPRVIPPVGSIIVDPREMSFVRSNGQPIPAAGFSCAGRFEVDGPRGAVTAVSLWHNLGTRHETSTMTSYVARTAADFAYVAPRVMRRYWGYTSGLTIVHAGTNAADIRVEYTFPNGTFVHTFTGVAPGDVLSKYLGEETGEGIPPGSLSGDGSAKITSTEPILALSSSDYRVALADIPYDQQNIGAGTTYVAPPRGRASRRWAVPGVFQLYGFELLDKLTRYSGVSLASGITVTNAEEGPNHCVVEVRSNMGAQTVDNDLAPSQTWGVFLPNRLTLPPGAKGSAIVTCERPAFASSSLSFRKGANGTTMVPGDSYSELPAIVVAFP